MMTSPNGNMFRVTGFVRRIHRSPVNFPHKGQWRRALMFSLICAWINGWINNRDASDLRRHRAHYDVTIMLQISIIHVSISCFAFQLRLLTLPNVALIHFTQYGDNCLTVCGIDLFTSDILSLKSEYFRQFFHFFSELLTESRSCVNLHSLIGCHFVPASMCWAKRVQLCASSMV